MQDRPFKIGVALGGGAFRGLAHIGVLQVLEQAGIVPDIVTGTSMGALVGGVYACGMSLSLMERFCYSISEKDLIDVCRPREGIVAGNRVELMLRTLTGNRTFDQLDRTFAAVATDLSRGERVVLRSGPVYQAIRASISIPGIFNPYRIDGVTYVDGGVVDRVPISAARELGADFVIGVDVGYHGGAVDCDGSLVKIILHTLEVMEWQIMQRTVNTADLNIVPALAQINPASIAQAEECIRIGRDEATAHLPGLLKAIEARRNGEGDGGTRFLS